MKKKLLLTLGLLISLVSIKAQDSVFVFRNQVMVMYDSVMISEADAPTTGGLSSGLVSLWELDESSAPLEDDKGSNDATTTDGITFGQATVTNLGTSILFDGSDPVLQPTFDDPSLELQPPFSVSFWMKEAGASDYYLRLYTGSDGWIMRSSSAGIVEFYVRATDGGTSSNSPVSNDDLTDDAWHNVIGVCTNDSTYMYVDGVLQTDVDENTLNTIDYTSPTFEWGTNAGASDYAGNMDQVAIWERALGQTAADSIYNSGSGRAYTNW